jgi:hypothetical protein
MRMESDVEFSCYFSIAVGSQSHSLQSWGLQFQRTFAASPFSLNQLPLAGLLRGFSTPKKRPEAAVFLHRPEDQPPGKRRPLPFSDGYFLGSCGPDALVFWSNCHAKPPALPERITAVRQLPDRGDG